MYLVTVVKDIYDSEYNSGVEVAGVFESEEKALVAKEKIISWLEEEEYEDYEIFVTLRDINRLKWDEINERI